MEEEQSIFDALSPKQTFIVGLVGGFLVFCTIGFFILLNLYLGGDFPDTERAATGNRGDSAAFADSGAAPSPAAQPTPSANADAVAPVNDADHIRGDADASITIVEYSDIECPFCSQFHNTMKQVLAEYDGQVRWVYRHFPLTSIHPNAVTGALASECAGEQGKFWEFTDLAFENQRSGINLASLRGFAEDVGLNISEYDNCVSERRYQDKVTSETRNAQETGGRGTPHSVIIGPNGQTQILSGAQPFAAVQAAIEQYL